MATKVSATKTAATKKVAEEVKETVNDSNEEMISKEEYLHLLKKVEELSQKINTPVEEKREISKPVYGADEEVPVISMCLGKLNLCTEKNGEGSCYTFRDLNEIVDIPFNDLKDIVRNNPRFVKEGYFYIADERAVKALRKTADYKRIIPVDTIVNIFNYSPDRIIDIYKMAPQGQQELIEQMIIDKRLNAEKVDANVMIELGKLAEIDFLNMEPINQ